MALLENAVPVNSVGGCAIAKLGKPSEKRSFCFVGVIAIAGKPSVKDNFFQF